jgi:putative transposase
MDILFNNLMQARKVTVEWLIIYNSERAYGALIYMTPSEYKPPNSAASFST